MIITEPNIETRISREYIGAYISDGVCLIKTYHLFPSNQSLSEYNVALTGANPIIESLPPCASSPATPHPGLYFDIILTSSTLI